MFSVFILFVTCADRKQSNSDLINGTFPELQEELRIAVMAIIKDAETANIEGLQSAHLNSNKFTKFGPRNFDRQNLESTNKSEAAFFGAVSDYKQEIKDMKIDMFGDIGIVTYYPHVSFVRNGETKHGSGRQTFVFLRTGHGWKIVHEHGTARQQAD